MSGAAAITAMCSGLAKTLTSGIARADSGSDGEEVQSRLHELEPSGSPAKFHARPGSPWKGAAYSVSRLSPSDSMANPAPRSPGRSARPGTISHSGGSRYSISWEHRVPGAEEVVNLKLNVQHWILRCWAMAFKAA